MDDTTGRVSPIRKENRKRNRAHVESPTNRGQRSRKTAGWYLEHDREIETAAIENGIDRRNVSSPPLDLGPQRSASLIRKIGGECKP